jgi:hypothetical protein
VLSWRFGHQLGGADPSRTFIGRYESLSDDLFAAFERHARPLDQEARRQIAAAPPINASGRRDRDYRAHYGDAGLIDLVGRLDREIIDRFGYTF